jgi:peroxiredoxin
MLRGVVIATVVLTLICAIVCMGDVAAGESRPDAPGFALKSVKGENVTLSSLRGKVVLLNFWALWCPPCKAELPSMDKLQRMFGVRGLVVLAVTSDRPESVMSYLENSHYEFTVLLDADSKVYDTYRIFVLPTSFLIDRQGRVVGRFMGERDWMGPQALRDIKGVL